MLSTTVSSHLSDQCASRCALVPPCWWQHSNSLVVPRQTVDAGFYQDEAELGVLVFAVALEMLANGDGLEIISMTFKT